MVIRPRPEVYDTYWYFAAERQSIFFNRLRGQAPPYTNDPILASYKFCNVYRACDRVSQFLIQSVIYGSKANEVDTLFRIFFFRLLNKIETWKQLENALGEPISLKNFQFERYDGLLGQLKADGAIYGNAFILCANKAFGHNQKHRNHLALLEKVFISSDHGKRLAGARNLEELFTLLRDLPLIGNFMAYQIAIDFNYSEVFNFSENDFTIAGPGAERGIAKCFDGAERLDSAEAIQFMVQNQDKEFKRLGLTFQPLGPRPLQAIDCQGLFCETDKYCRVKFPELASNRKRIKTRYVPTAEPLQFFFPPKWKIGDLQ